METIRTVFLGLLVTGVWMTAIGLIGVEHRLDLLNRIPVANAVDYGTATETREQRIDRVARQRLQMLDDDSAVSERVRQLRADRTKPQSPK